MAVAVLVAVVSTASVVPAPAGAAEGAPAVLPLDPAVTLDEDGTSLHVGWEMWRGSAAAADAVEEWVVSAAGINDVVVDADAVSATVDGLDVEAHHVFTVRARNESGDGTGVTAAFDPDLHPPQAPMSGLDVRPTATAGQLLVGWDTPALTDPPVEMVRVTWPGGAEDVLSSAPQGVTIDGLPDGVPAVVTARARSAHGWGPVAKARPMAPATPLLGPPDIAAEATGDPGTVEVTWGDPTPGSEGSSPIEGFEVLWAGGSETVAATDRSLLIDGLEDGRAYRVGVAARNGAGPGVIGWVSDVVPSGPPTAAPAGVTASATGTSGQVQVGWDQFPASGDGGAALTGFRVAAGDESIQVTSPAQARLDGLPNGVASTVTVQAVNPNGAGPEAVVEVVASGPPTAAPGWPGVRPTTTSGRMVVTWEALTGEGADGGSALTGYDLRWGPNPDQTLQVDADTFEATIDGLTDGAGVGVELRARNTHGPGPWSSPGYGVSGAPIHAPSGLRVATSSATSVEVTWDPLPREGQGVDPIGRHVIQVTNMIPGGGGASWEVEAVADATSAVISDLTAGADYQLWVRGQNVFGFGPGASTSTFTAGRPTAPPSGVEAAATGDNGEVEVTWDALTGPGFGTDPQVVVRTGDGTEVVVPGTATSALVTGLTDGTEHTFAVTVRTAQGEGPPAEAVAATPAGPPTGPPAVTLRPGPARVRVSWAAVTDDGGSPVTGYRVRWTVAGKSGAALVDGGAVAHAIDGLDDGVDVTVTVAAVNERGEGPSSQPAASRPGRPPVVPPSNVEAEATGVRGQVEVRWEGIAVTEWGDGEPTGFVISWNGGEASAGVVDRSALIDGLDANGTYAFTVAATNDPYGAGPTGSTGPVVVAHHPLAAPDVETRYESGGIGLRWDEVIGDGGIPVTGYVVEWRRQGHAPQTAEIDPDAREHVIGSSDVVHGETYEVRVWARNDAGDGPGWQGNVRPGIAPTGAPLAMEVAPTGELGELEISWDPIEPDGWGTGEPAGYRIYWGPGPQDWAEVPLERTSYVITGLANEQHFYVTMAGFTDYGNGPTSFATARTRTAPTVAPTGVRAFPATVAGRVRVEWNPAGRPWTLDHDSSWVVTWPGGAQELPRQSSSVDISGLDPAARVSFRVRARNPFGDGPASVATAPVIPSGTPPRANLLTQPSAESGELGWVGLNADVAPAAEVPAHDGVVSLRIEATGTVAGVPPGAAVDPAEGGVAVVPGETYRFSAFVDTRDVPRRALPLIVWVDADGHQLPAITEGVPVLEESGTWTEVSVSGTAPPGASGAMPLVNFADAAPGESHYLDGAVLTVDPDEVGPNLLSEVQASFERGTTGWTSRFGTLARSTDVGGHTGLTSLRFADDGRAPPGEGLGAFVVPEAIGAVEPGTVLSGEVWARTPAETASVAALLSFLDAGGRPVDPGGVTLGAAIDVTADGWARVQVSTTVPDGAVNAGFGVVGIDGPSSVMYLDDASVWIGPATATDPANRLDAAVSGLETGEIGWVGEGSTVGRSIDEARQGFVSFRVETAEGARARTDVGTAGAPVISGTAYTASVWGRALETLRELRVGLTWYDGAGAEIGSVTSPRVAEAAGDWRQLHVTGVAPPGSAHASLSVEVLDASADEVHHIDDIAICEGTSPDCLRDQPPPWAPEAVEIAQVEGDDDAVTVRWAADAALVAADEVTGYRIRWGGGDVTVDGSTARQTVIDGLSSVDRHQVEVSAANGHGEGPSLVSRPFRLNTPPLAPPTGVAAVASAEESGTVTVTWDPYDPDGAPLERFEVRWGSGPDEALTVSHTATSATIEGLDESEGYVVTVAAGNKHGTGPASAEVQIDHTGCPTPTRSGHAQAVLADAPVAYFRLGERMRDPVAAVAFDEVSCIQAQIGDPPGGGGASGVAGALAGDPDGALERGWDDPDAPQIGAGALDVSLTELPVDGDLTIEMWARTPGDGGVLYALYGTLPVLAVAPDDWAGAADPGFLLDVGEPEEWHHYALTIDGASPALYIDGLPAALPGYLREGELGSLEEHVDPSGHLVVLGGAVDELAVFDRALSAGDFAGRVADGRRADTTTTLHTPAAGWPADGDVAATVTVASPGAGPAPVGQVELIVDGAVVDIASVRADGTADLAAQVGPGRHRLSARYTGSSTSVASSSRTIDLGLGSTATETTLTLSDAEVTYGGAVIATVTSAEAGSDQPLAGVVEISVGGVVRRTIDLDPSGQGQAELPLLDAGRHRVTARTRPTADHAASTDTAPLEVVAADVVAEVDRDPWQWEVTLTGVPGGASPTGLVEAWSGSTLVGRGAVLPWPGDGGARVLLQGPGPDLDDGTYPIEYRYTGDRRYASRVLTGELALATEVSAYVRPTIVRPGEEAHLEVWVTRLGVRPDGIIDILVDGAVAATIPLEDGQAIWPLPDLPAGDHVFAVRFGAATSADQTVAYRHDVEVVLDQEIVVWGDVLIGRVRSATPGITAIPQGWVNLEAGALGLGGVWVEEDGTFSIRLDRPDTVGSHDVTASFNPVGDQTIYTASTSDVQLEVLRATSALTVHAPPVVWTPTFRASANLSPDVSWYGSDQREVELFWDDSSEPVATIDLRERSWVELDVLPGRHTLRAEFAGTAELSPATATTVVATPPDAEIVVDSVSPSTATYGEFVTVTGQVRATDPDDTRIPTGVLHFAGLPPTYGQAVLGANGSFTLTGRPRAGTGLDLSYSGDSTFHAVTVEDTGTVEVARAASALGEPGEHVTQGTDIEAPIWIDGHQPPHPVEGEATASIDGGPPVPATISAEAIRVATDSIATGRHDVTLTYAGSDDLLAASRTDSIVVGTIASITVVPPEQPEYGVPTTVTGAVTSQTPTGPPPTGQVCHQATGRCSPVAADGTYSIPVTFAAVGPASMAVRYAGDDHHVPAYGWASPVVVAKAPTDIDIQARVGTASPLDVVLTVTVTDPGPTTTPAGRIEVRVDDPGGPLATQYGVSSGSPPPDGLQHGAATFRVALPTPGEHTLHVRYVPRNDGAQTRWNPSHGTITWEADAPTETTATLDPEPPVAGQPFDLAVEVITPFDGTPQGSVRVTIGDDDAVTATLDADGRAVLSDLEVPIHGTVPIVAELEPGPGWAASAWNETVTVAPAPVEITVGEVPARVPYGATIDLVGRATTPTGTPLTAGGIVFWAQDPDPGGRTVELGSATVDPTGRAGIAYVVRLDVRGWHVRASYTGDETHDDGWSGSSPIEVERAEPTISFGAVATPPGDIQANRALRLFAAVAADVGPGAVKPTGFVTFFDGSEAVGTVPVTARTGAAVLEVPSGRPGGTRTFRAVYGGSAHYATATADMPVDITALPTATALTAPATAVDIGTPVDLDAAVTAYGSPVTRGIVRFMEGGEEIGRAPLELDGHAAASIILDPGAHQITAEHLATADNAASTSAVAPVLVARPTHVEIGPVVGGRYGQTSKVPVTVQAPTADDPATGQVRLVWADADPDDDAQPAPGPWVPLGPDGSGTLTATLGAGRHPATVEYTGTPLLAPATSEPFDVVVDRATLPVSLFVSPPTLSYSSQLSLTARVDPIPGVGPAGFVSFYDGEVPLGTAKLTAAGRATIATRTLTPGTHQITARFGGTADLSLVRSTAAPVTVETAVATIDVAPPAALRADGTGQIQADVRAPGGAPATGPVQLWALPPGGDQILIDTQQTDDRGHVVFTCAASESEVQAPCGPLEAGPHTFKMVRAQGDDRIGAGESEPFTFSVQPGAVATVTVSNPPPVAFTGRRVPIVSKVTSTSGRIPEGTVSLVDAATSTVLVSHDVDGDGITVLETGDLPAGTAELVVAYSGDDLNGPATSPPFTIDIRPATTVVMTTPPPTFPAGGESQPIELAVRRRDGTPMVAPAGGIELTLSATSVAAYFRTAAADDVRRLTIPEGASSATFTVRNRSAGRHDILVTAPHIGITEWQRFPFTVQAGPATEIVVLPAQRTAVVGTAALPYKVFAADVHGNELGDVTAQTTITAGSGATCNSSAACTPTTSGEHPITATHAGMSATATLVGNALPVPEIVSVTPTPNDPRLFTFTLRASDADGDDLEYLVDWGDGSATTAVTDLPEGEFTLSHRYGGPPAEMVFRVADGVSDPVWTSTHVEGELALVLRADPGDDQVGVVGQPVHFDGADSTPRSDDLRYEWDFGDGTSSTQIDPDHVYDAPGQYTVTLRVKRGTATSQPVTVIVNITASDGTGVFVRVKAGTTPISGAAVVVNSADDIAHRAVEQPGTPGTYVIPGLPEGQHSLYAYREGYTPVVVGFAATGGADVVDVTLDPGSAARGEVRTRRLSYLEAVNLGVEHGTAEGQHVVEYEIYVERAGVSLQVFQSGSGECIMATDDRLFLGRNDDGAGHEEWERSCDLTIGGRGFGLRARMTGGTLVLMHKTRASWAKEVFEVTFEVYNLSPDGFELAAGTATIDLPDRGLGLAEMATGAQSTLLGVPVIPAGGSAIAQWIVRGDLEGIYDLSVDYTAVLDPVGEPVHTRAETDHDSRIRVWGLSAIQGRLDADASVVAAQPNHQQLAVTNVADVPVYNLRAGLSVGRGGDRVSVLAQPRQAGEATVGQLGVGQTLTSPEARLLYDVSGRIPDHISATAGGAQVAITTRHRANPSRRPTPVLAPAPAGILEGGAQLTWSPVPDAIRYEVYATSQYGRAFPAAPLARTDEDETSVQLPPQGGYGLLAVTAIVERDGREVREMSHPLLEAGELSQEPDPRGIRPIDPCRGFGSHPTVAAPGNFSSTRSDGAINALGPPLALTRTYNSLGSVAPYEGRPETVMGLGWSFSLGVHGMMDIDGNTGLVLGDGSCVPARENPAAPGTYLIDGRGERWTANFIDTGDQLTSHTIVRNHTSKTTYRANTRNGGIDWIEDANRHRQVFHYTPVPPGAEPWLPEYNLPRSVEDEASGRRYWLEWNDDEDADAEHVKLLAVRTDPVTTSQGKAALEWTYHYDGNLLVAACGPVDSSGPDAGGTCETYAYDDDRMVAMTDRTGATTRISYDADGRMAEVTDAEGGRTSFAYGGSNGHRVTVADPRGNVTVAEYDAAYRLTRAVDPIDEVEVAYDSHGYMSSIDAGSASASFDRTANGIPTAVTTAAGTTWSGVDGAGNVTSTTSNRGSGAGDPSATTTVAYDAAHRPILSRTPAASGAPTGAASSWSYSGETWTGTRWVGTAAAEGGGVVPNGLLVEQRAPGTDGAATETTTYRYDAAGNRVRTQTPTGLVITAAYDELGRTTTETVSGPGVPATTTAYTYDATGQIVEILSSKTVDAVTDEQHQVRTEVTRDGVGRPTLVVQRDVLGDTPTRETAIGYDGLGREVSRSVRVDADRTAVTTQTYDTAGNVVEAVDAEGVVTRRTYDAANRVLSVTVDGVREALNFYHPATGRLWHAFDALGRRTTYTYDAAGRPTKATRHGGPNGATHVVAEVTYDAGGAVVRRAVADGTVVTTYVVDNLGRIIEETLDPGGLDRVTGYEYDALGHVVRERITGPPVAGAPGPVVDQVVERAYDDHGRMVAEVVDPGGLGLLTSYGYDALGRRTTATDPRGAVTTTAYDAAGQVVSTTGAPVPVNGGAAVAPVTTYGLDAFGQATSVEDPLGRVTTSRFNAAGWLIEETAPPYTRPSDGDTLTASTTYQHDLLGRAVEVAGPEGTTSTDFDAHGRVTRTEAPRPTPGHPAVSTSAYDPLGRLTTSTTSAGLVTTRSYDWLDREVTSTDHVPAAGGNPAVDLTTTSAYDDAGNPVRVVDPAGGVTTTGYNAAREVTETLSPWQHETGDDQPTTYVRDHTGRPLVTTDPTGRATGAVYDAAGRQIAHGPRVEGTWQLSELDLDPNGNVVAETTPEGRVTTSTYDAADRLSSVTAGSATTSFGYDLVGNQTRLVDGRGNTTTTEFNSRDLVERVVEPATPSQPDLADRTWVSSYDAAGRQVERIEPGGITVASSYDAAGNLVLEEGTGPAGVVPASRRLRYDASGQMVGSWSAAGETVSTYDARGLLVAQQAPGAPPATSAYDAGGRLVERSDGRGTASFAYGPGGLLASMVDPVSGRSSTYSYDPAGHRTAQTTATPGYVPGGDGPGDAETTTWAYDDAGRLSEMTVAAATGALRRGEQRTYDADGNLLTQTVTAGQAPAVVEAYGYDPAGRLIQITDDTGTRAVGWDAAGNRSSDGEASYTYDERNRLVATTRNGTTTATTWSPAGARTSTTAGDGTTRAATFDALGRVATDGDVTYTWDAQDRITTRTSGGADDPDAFAYDGHALDPISVGDTQRGTDPAGAPVSVDDTAVTTDAHGDIVTATDPDGTTHTSAYDPWGTPTSNDPAAGPFGYQGDYTDPTTAAVWMGARTYDPATATFTTRDTWPGTPTNPVTLNRYTYANANPLRFHDPNGHWAEEDEYAAGKVRQNLYEGWVQNTSLFLIGAIGISGVAMLALAGGLGASSSIPGLREAGIALMALAVVTLIAVKMPNLMDIVTDIRDVGGDVVTGLDDFVEAAPTPVVGAAAGGAAGGMTGGIPGAIIGAGAGAGAGAIVDSITESATSTSSADNGPCRETFARTTPRMRGDVAAARRAMYSNPDAARAHLSPAEAGAVEELPWLTRIQFGNVMQREVDIRTDAYLRFVGSHIRWADFQIRNAPQCYFELTTDNPATVAAHQVRIAGAGMTQRVQIVTYRALDGSWRFPPR